MSQPSSITSSGGPPKKFLKKGEGLKRFAAYRPPLPMTVGKFQRRQTFVKFKLDEKVKFNQPSFIPPEILNDESINLSTEIPKIAPPKIMHTPIRPNRQALGALRPTTLNIYDYDSDEQIFDRNHFNCPRGHENGSPTEFLTSDNRATHFPNNKQPPALHEKNLSRKVAMITPTGPNKMISFNGFRKPAVPDPRPTPSPVAQPVMEDRKVLPEPKSNDPPRRYNLRGSRRTESEANNLDDVHGRDAPKKEPRRTKRQIKAIVERHISPQPNQESPVQDLEEPIPAISESQINGNIDILMKKIEKRKSSLNDGATRLATGASLRVSDLSTPSPGNCISALGLQIQQIQSTVNELRERIKNCECGNLLSPGEAQAKRSTRKTTRAKANEKTRPSAHADNSTPKIIISLVDEVSQLKARLDEMSLRPNTLTGNKEA